MYDPQLVEPMRKELTSVGVTELTSASEVDEQLGSPEGTVLVVVNSVCGCAAGGARPGVAMALQHSNLPDKTVTVFAGQDKEATERARSYFAEFPPSSPSIALLKNGSPVLMLERHGIDGHTAEEIAEHLKSAFDEHCSG